MFENKTSNNKTVSGPQVVHISQEDVERYGWRQEDGQMNLNAIAELFLGVVVLYAWNKFNNTG